MIAKTESKSNIQVKTDRTVLAENYQTNYPKKVCAEGKDERQR